MKVKYEPAGDANSATLAVQTSDELVVATTEKPFETDDPALQGELDASPLFVRAAGKPKGD